MSSADELNKWKNYLMRRYFRRRIQQAKESILNKKSLVNSLNQYISISVIGFALVLFLFNSDNNQSVGNSTSTTVLEIEQVVPLEQIVTDTNNVVSSIDDINKAVVQIESSGSYASFDENFNLVDSEQYSYGSGFIISSNGYIVTNNHVVAGASIVKIYFPNQDAGISAEIVSQSECGDLALLKIDRNNLLYFDWAEETPDVGLEIFAAGFPLGDPEFTLLDGIITKKNADGNTPWSSIESTFEHNAEIKTGNSGGPIIDKNTFKVVGVAYAKTVTIKNLE